MSFKKINAWVHLWFGLASGIVVFILGITGCVLVFKEEIKTISSPWMRAEKPEGGQLQPPSVLIRSLQKYLPGKEIESVWYHGEGRTAHFGIHESDSIAYVNPYTAEVAAIVDHEDAFHFFEDGHYYLWLPQKIGHQVAGWGTLIFFLLLISGLILWWPKRWNKKGREQAFTIKWKAKLKRVNYDLHNVLGFYSIIVAIILAFTGLMMSFAWFNKSVYWLAGGDKKTRVEALSDTTTNLRPDLMAQVDKAWHKGIYEIAEHRQFDILMHWPEKASEAIYVCTDMYNGTWRDVYLDQYTLAELPASQKRVREEALADWLRRYNYGLHVGLVGGLPVKIIYFIVSLICASLPVTGFYIWWGKKKKTGRASVRKRTETSIQA